MIEVFLELPGLLLVPALSGAVAFRLSRRGARISGPIAAAVAGVAVTEALLQLDRRFALRWVCAPTPPETHCPSWAYIDVVLALTAASVLAAIVGAGAAYAQRLAIKRR